MTRDELILAAMAAGATTTVALIGATGVTERTCRYGLSHLITVGYVWSPERGRWRLTDAGQAIAATLPSLSAAEPPAAESTTLPVTESGTVVTAHAAQPALLPKDTLGTPASVWWALAGIAGAVVVALTRRSASSPPPAPPPAPPTVWPYNGWRI